MRAYQDDTGYGKIPEDCDVDQLAAQIDGFFRAQEISPLFKFTDDIVIGIDQQQCLPVTAMIERSAKHQTETLRVSIRKNAVEGLVTRETDPKLEILFLIDTSGSMSGGRMTYAKQAMQIFLRSLPEGCSFNLIEFNSNYTSLFPQVQDYSEYTLKNASGWVDRLSAGGGTNIMKPLRFIYDQCEGTQEGFTRSIILLTDGEVGNEGECIRKVANNEGTRCFTLGVGQSFSEGLCRGMAEAGQGSFEAARNPDQTATASMRLLEAACTPALVNPTINLGEWASGGAVVKQIPEKIPTLFPGKRTNIYFVKSISAEGEGEMAPVAEFDVAFTAIIDGQRESLASVNVNASPEAREGMQEASLVKNNTLVLLSAKAEIREIENKTSVAQDVKKAQLVSLGTMYNLVSSETSFIGVHTGEGELSTTKLKNPEPVWESSNMMMMSNKMHMVRKKGMNKMQSKSRSAPRRNRGMEKRSAPRRNLDMQKSRSARPRPQTNNISFAMPKSAAAAPQYEQEMMMDCMMESDCLSAVSSGLNMDYSEEDCEDSMISTMSAKKLKSSKPVLRNMSYTLLLNSQQFNGAFDFNMESFPEYSAAVVELRGMGCSDEVIQTLIAIHVLKTKYGKSSGEWGMMVKKAKKFVTKQGHSVDGCLQYFTNSN